MLPIKERNKGSQKMYDHPLGWIPDHWQCCSTQRLHWPMFLQPNVKPTQPTENVWQFYIYFFLNSEGIVALKRYTYDNNNILIWVVNSESNQEAFLKNIKILNAQIYYCFNWKALNSLKHA